MSEIMLLEFNLDGDRQFVPAIYLCPSGATRSKSKMIGHEDITVKLDGVNIVRLYENPGILGKPFSVAIVYEID